VLDLIIITGASKGIGKSIAEKCSTICQTMLAISSSDSIYNEEHIDKNCEYIPCKLDLQDYKSVYNKLNSNSIRLVINPLMRSIGIVLCGAQIGEHGGLLGSNLDDWDKLYQCNVLGNLAVVKACAQLLTKVKTRIVFLAGGGAAFSYPEFSGYALSKVATVRAAENLSLELSKCNHDSSVISIAPGAVATDILAKVIAHGGEVRTKTDISEPTNFVYKFLNDEFNAKELDGKFLHVRDDFESTDFSNKDIFKLRRIQ
jgi:benzil reductase ((S)-benzoin forming)